MRADVEKETVTHLWGTAYTFVPRLVDQVWGDGQRLIWVSNTDTRPYYYVVRVDSSWYAQPNGMKDRLNNDIVLDNLNDIEEAIMEQFGWYEYGEDDPGSNAEIGEFSGFPVWPLFGNGASFGGYSLE